MTQKEMTEDEVRTLAGSILHFVDGEDDAKQGVGQLTTFNQLGFKKVNDKPDGWYLPHDIQKVAIILEVKKTSPNISKQVYIDELLKNIMIAQTKYKKVIGVLYNGYETLVYKNLEKIAAPRELQNKEFYLSLFNENKIDKQKIYNLTKQINDNLHFNFGIKNLNHRMIFTACALVAERYDGNLSKIKDMGYSTFHTSIHSTIAKSYANAIRQNSKLNLLLEVYSGIKMNNPDNQEAINDFIDNVVKISDSINSDYWNGEDVMAIFFNEFNRYKGKSESGQVFTPDHITSLMYHLIEVNKDDIVLDAACGSGSFLVKAMCNMIKEAGGTNTEKAKQIKQNQLYGIEFDKEIFALACANMLIHKDGKTNLEQLDTRTAEAAEWIRSKNISKVLMNPPFENKYGCIPIVKQVLDNVAKDTLCAFILPDKKLEKVAGAKKILNHHTLLKIIKLPENIFNEGITTSVFIFKAGVPQGDKEIFACYIEDDGLETVKNQGRQDIRDRWEGIEKQWLEIICKQSGSDTIQWLKPSEHLSYQMPKKEFEIYEEDFTKTIMDYLMFKEKIAVKDFQQKLIHEILYSGKISDGYDDIVIRIPKSATIDKSKTLHTDWREFRIGDLFTVVKGTRLTRAEMKKGTIRFIGASAVNNGVTASISNDEKIHTGNTITVSYNGSTGEAFYQDEPFWASDDVNVLYPKFPLNKEIALFIIPIIKKIGKRYNFVDKWKKEDMENDTIKLPATNKNEPDWKFMEKYIEERKKFNEQELNVLIGESIRL